LLVAAVLVVLVAVSYGASRFIMYEKKELEKKH
jgi:hypothetical protein